MASAAAMSRKRAAAVDSPASTKRQRFTTADEEAWNSRSPNQDVDTPIAGSTPSSHHSPAASELEPSIADTSVTSATTSKRPKRYLCDYEGCGKAFDRPIRLQMHTRSHTGERPYPCPEDGCDKAFLRSEHLKAHAKAKHSTERNHVCTYTLHDPNDGTATVCSKAFTTATKLRRHIAMHEEKEQTKCPTCGKEFRKQETLQRHIKTDHLNEPAFRCTHVEIGANDLDEPEECGLEFKNARQLRSHTAREHSGTRYFCQICAPETDPDGVDIELDTLSIQTSALGFATYAELQSHTKTAHPPSCPTCGAACASNRALKAHIEIEHTSVSDRARFECSSPGCGRRFTKNGNLKVHEKTVHAKKKTFTCGEFSLEGSAKVEGWDGLGCGFSFGTKANLEEHVRTQHLGLEGMYKRKVQREREGKVEGEKKGVEVAGVVTGFGYEEVRPIACLEGWCEQRFVREYDLAAHLEVVHGWCVDDVQERMAEREALEGGKFWIGGGEEIEAQEDVELRRRLVEGLQLEGRDEQAASGNGLLDFLADQQAVGGVEAIDPMLTDA